MKLDPEFENMMEDWVNQMIEHNIQRMNVEDDKNEKEVWKYENSFDYHYGRTIGMLTREFHWQFLAKYEKQPDQEQQIAISTFLHKKSDKIRQALSIYK